MSLMPTGLKNDDWDDSRPLGAAFHNDVPMGFGLSATSPYVPPYVSPTGAEVYGAWDKMRKLRMYALRPRGYGAETFFVVAESEQDAMSKITAYVKADEHICMKTFINDVNDGAYSFEVYNLGVVATNDNG